MLIFFSNTWVIPVKFSKSQFFNNAVKKKLNAKI